MQLLTNERRYASWTVTSRTELGSVPEVAYRKFGDTSWTWVTAQWNGPDEFDGNGNHKRECSTLFCGPDAAGAGAAVLTAGRYETQIRYTDTVEVIAAETGGITVIPI